MGHVGQSDDPRPARALSHTGAGGLNRRTMNMDKLSTTADGVPDNPLSEANSDYRLPWNLDLGVGVQPRTTCYELGMAWVMGWRSVGRMTARRGTAEFRRTPGEFVGVLMLEQGSQVLVQQGCTAEISAGATTLWDGTRPMEAFSDGRLVKRTMFVPR